MAQASAARLQNNTAGNVIRFRKIARPHPAWTPLIAVNKPINCFENTAPSRAMTAETAVTSQKTRCAKVQASPRGFPRKYPVKTGIKEPPREPSPVMRRIKLGIRKTRINESAAGEVPSNSATR